MQSRCVMLVPYTSTPLMLLHLYASIRSAGPASPKDVESEKLRRKLTPRHQFHHTRSWDLLGYFVPLYLSPFLYFGGKHDVLTAAALFSLAVRTKSQLSDLLKRMSLNVGVSFGLHVRWLFFSVSLLAFLVGLVLSEGPASVLFACLVDTMIRIWYDDTIRMFSLQSGAFGIRQISETQVSISLSVEQKRDSIVSLQNDSEPSAPPISDPLPRESKLRRPSILKDSSRFSEADIDRAALAKVAGESNPAASRMPHLWTRTTATPSEPLGDINLLRRSSALSFDSLADEEDNDLWL
ncbi:hypothetical protein MRX96_025994 [Rhipicephalus microplus]